MVKPAGSEQGAVQTVRSVCGSYNHHIFVANFLTVQLSSKGGKKKKVKQIAAHCSAATLSMKMGKIQNTIISNHLLSVDFLHSFSLQDLLCTPPLHGLQANSIHLIEKHGQETRLCAVGCLSGWPRVDQRVDLIKEQDRRSAGTGLAKELHTHTDS